MRRWQPEAVLDCARKHVVDGMAGGTSGNISVRDREGDCVWITPSGVPYEALSVDRVVCVDPEGEVLSGSGPSSETPLHLAIYGARPDVGAIVHTHSTFATVYSMLRRPIVACHYLIGFAGREVGVADYRCFGTSELADSAVRALGDGRAVLLANHGVVAVGEGLDTAYRVAWAVEEVAKLQHHAEQVGVPVVLSHEEMTEVLEQMIGYGYGSSDGG